MGRKRRLVKKLRLVSEPSEPHRRNLIRKLVPKLKERSLESDELLKNWVPMTLEEYEESYQQLLEREGQAGREGSLRRKFDPKPAKQSKSSGKKELKRSDFAQRDKSSRAQSSRSKGRPRQDGFNPPRPAAPPVLTVFMSPPGSALSTIQNVFILNTKYFSLIPNIFISNRKYFRVNKRKLTCRTKETSSSPASPICN